MQMSIILIISWCCYLTHAYAPLCSAAAVASERIDAPTKTPCFQSNASYTSGTPCGRRPPNKMASMGTPRGLSQSSSIMGHCEAGVQNL